MSKVSLRRLLSKLTALALTTSAIGPAAAEPAPARESDVDEDPDLGAETAIDREQVATGDAAAALGRSLALALAEVRPLRATHMVTTWALADEPLRRLAVAMALEWTFPLVGDALVI